MNLNTSRLKLIEISEVNIPEIHKLNSFPEVARFNTIGIPESMDVTTSLLHDVINHSFLEDRKLYGWAIRLKDTNEFIGETGMQLSAARYKRAEIYYNFIPQHWFNGYATEAVEAVIGFGFKSLKLHRIEAGVAVENIGSIRVLEKAGMQREGRKRKILPLADGWSDNFGYAILREDVKD
jgi:RimJ/RimL family protein N-acetyltransferase